MIKMPTLPTVLVLSLSLTLIPSGVVVICRSLLNLLIILRFSLTLLGMGDGDSTAQWLAHMLTDPAAPGSIPSFPEIFSEEKIADVTEVNQWCCLEKTEKMLMEPIEY